MEFCVPLLFDHFFVDGAALVVEDLEINAVTVFLQSGHDAVGCSEAMAVVLGLEGLDHDDVAVLVVRENNVLVAAAGADGETTHVVGVELADVADSDVEYF